MVCHAASTDHATDLTDPELVRDLYLKVGVDYERVLLLPQVRSAIRNLTSEYEAKVLYSSERSKLSIQLTDDLNKHVKSRGIVSMYSMYHLFILFFPLKAVEFVTF